MKPLYYFILLLVPSVTFGQRGFGAGFNSVQNGFSSLNSFYNVVNSEPVTVPTYPKEVEGTPFFHEEWLKGIITMSDGKSYKGESIKLDLMNNKLYFMEGSQAKACTEPVDRLILLDSATNRVYIFLHSTALPPHADLRDYAWVEALVMGDARLLKYTKKEINEYSNYGGAPTMRIKTVTRYYVQYKNQLQKVASVGDIQDILRDKYKKEVQEYVKQEKPSWKNESQVSSLVAYFNSLSEKQ